MTSHPNPPTEAPASPLLKPILRFIAFSIEMPATAAVRVASALTALAVLIHLKANLLNASASGSGFAILYASTAWAIALYLRAQSRSHRDDS